MRIGVAWLTLGALGVGLVGWATAAPAAERHSGTVMKVDAKARTLVVQEIGANAKARTLSVRVTPQAKVVLSERVADDKVTDVRHPFTDTSIGFPDLRPGDFIVLELEGEGEKAAASSVTVTFRGAARGR